MIESKRIEIIKDLKRMYIMSIINNISDLISENILNDKFVYDIIGDVSGGNDGYDSILINDINRFSSDVIRTIDNNKYNNLNMSIIYHCKISESDEDEYVYDLKPHINRKIKNISDQFVYGIISNMKVFLHKLYDRKFEIKFTFDMDFNNEFNINNLEVIDCIIKNIDDRNIKNILNKIYSVVDVNINEYIYKNNLQGYLELPNILKFDEYKRIT